MKRLTSKTNDRLKSSKPVIDTRKLSASVKKYFDKLSDADKYIDKNGFIKNNYDNDMQYSKYTLKQHEQLGAYDASYNNGWKNDYVLLNTDKWLPPITHSMNKCKIEKTCAVCPNLTQGYPVNVKDFNLARKILPPDDFNIDYIKDKLLTGKA